MRRIAEASFLAARRNADTPAIEFLRALEGSPDTDATGRRALLKTLADGQAEIDALRAEGTLGLTVQLDDVVVLDAHEGFLAGKGEIYTVSWLLDGSGRTAEFRSRVFSGIGDGGRLPVGGGGMLLGHITDPRWFLDLHAVVMESDSDVRNVGEAVVQAKQESGWDDLAQALGDAATADPTTIAQAVNVVGLLADLVTTMLKRNGDDHVATVHDFYLEQQGFGAGRHPAAGRQTFQDVETAYTIALSMLG